MPDWSGTAIILYTLQHCFWVNQLAETYGHIKACTHKHGNMIVSKYVKYLNTYSNIF